MEMDMDMELELELENMNLICGKQKLERMDKKTIRSAATGRVQVPGTRVCTVLYTLYSVLMMVWGPAGNLGWLGWIS